MKYEFDRLVDRRGTYSTKWDNVGNRIGNPNALPMWVADMDFPAPQPVIEAVRRRAESGIYGYAFLPPEFREATVRWMQLRHGWDISQGSVLYISSILPVLFAAVQTFTEPGDKIILQRPVYYPFFQAVENPSHSGMAAMRWTLRTWSAERRIQRQRSCSSVIRTILWAEYFLVRNWNEWARYACGTTCW